MTVTLARPWLDLDLKTPHRVLSWAVVNPGLVTARRILWREVRNADLPEDLDAAAWLRGELHRRGRADAGAVAMLTSRDLDAFETSQTTVDSVTATCIATVGLSNAERVGSRADRSGHDWGTINVALVLSLPLADVGLIETLSVVAEARTAAVIDAGHRVPAGLATGTGTDCIAVAAPAGVTAFAGLHTACGEAAGRATYDAVHRGARVWMETVRRPECQGGTT